ncbi:hypothetical protein RHECNPAF_122100126 [Rhizobium etli CNPAF512]|nr:hypothetical protein RHECNPAF_122100126 [Rhizobium etli CNPAF512]
MRCNRRSAQDRSPPRRKIQGSYRFFGLISHRTVLCLEPVEDIARRLSPARLGIGNAAQDGSVQCGKPGLPVLNQSNTFTEDFAFRAIAARVDKLLDIGFELLSQIGTNHSALHRS